MITMKNIIREGHPTLTKKAIPVAFPIEQKIKDTLKEMRQFLINSQNEETREKYELREGVGLAAPQIDLSLRMLAIYTEDETFENHHDYMMINPKIISHSAKETYIPGGEGCLSVDREVSGLVRRYQKVTVKTHLLDPDTDELIETTLRLRNFLAIVFQHELDHLNGVMFFTKVEPTLEGLTPIEFKLDEMKNENNKEETS